MGRATLVLVVLQYVVTMTRCGHKLSLHFDVDRDVSTATLRSLYIIRWCPLAVYHNKYHRGCDWWLSFLIFLTRRCSIRGPLFDHGPASGIPIPLSLLMLLRWSLLWMASLALWTYQWGRRSINFNLVPTQMVSGLISMFWGILYTTPSCSNSSTASLDRT